MSEVSTVDLNHGTNYPLRKSDLLRRLPLPLHHRPMARGRRLCTGHSNSVSHHGNNVWLPRHKLGLPFLRYGTPAASAPVLLFTYPPSTTPCDSTEHPVPHTLQSVVQAPTSGTHLKAIPRLVHD